jgi:hypothetical protein
MSSPVTTVWTDTPGGRGSVPSACTPEALFDAFDALDALDARETPAASSARAHTTRMSANAHFLEF